MINADRSAIVKLVRREQHRSAAAAMDAADLRTLDALHLATAASLGDDLEAFVAYDQRLLENAARSTRATCVAPGA